MKKVHHAQSLLPKKFWVDLLEDIILTDDYEGTSTTSKNVVMNTTLSICYI